MTEWLVADAPPSAKLVVKVLEYADDPLTQREISDRTRLSPRTVRSSIKRLKERDVVEERVYIPDARKQLYVLTEEAVQCTVGDEVDVAEEAA
ncbi:MULTISPECIES: winged helix-turn-helix domain-containing protein [Halorussus]|uniref:winged helix-turn-helix domain-containing protein n=1 Tax=Halorussus TaxID=1070314 RepID=UPI0020A02535|nr:winged helix-turn-helix domain-containing protein [Halorussus vallis]USZ78046.1 winged helix-turn-helix domain-containing protein [Halorussus vallis]